MLISQKSQVCLLINRLQLPRSHFHEAREGVNEPHSSTTEDIHTPSSMAESLPSEVVRCDGVGNTDPWDENGVGLSQTHDSRRRLPQKQSLKCPYRKCKWKRFPRRQEFVRHYATRGSIHSFILTKYVVTHPRL